MSEESKNIAYIDGQNLYMGTLDKERVHGLLIN
jgi:hypothetical protein